MAQIKKIRIAYDGPALANGAMDIKDLAPALLAFADLVKRANVVIGNERPVNLLLTADDINKGSFDISLQLVYSALDQAKLFAGFMDESGLTALTDVIGAAGTLGGGVFYLIKKIKNNNVKDIKEYDNKAEITLTDGTKILTTGSTFKVFLDHEARKNIEAVVRPLKSHGIDSFQFRNPDNFPNKEPLLVIEKDEVDYFKTPKLKSVEIPDNIIEQELIVKIVSIVFDKNQKWRFTDGDSPFWARIEDDVFWAKVQEGSLAFRDGDKLKVKMKSVQKVTNDELSSEKIITKVIEAIPKPTQITLIE